MIKAFFIILLRVLRLGLRRCQCAYASAVVTLRLRGFDGFQSRLFAARRSAITSSEMTS